MIMHLSAPADHSINDGIDKKVFTLHYTCTIDDAVKMVQHLGSTAELAKIDVKSAALPFAQYLYCTCKDRELLGIHWQDKLLRASHSDFGQPPPYLINMQMHCILEGADRSQQVHRFITCLPFGLRSAPSIFNQYADALYWRGLTEVNRYIDSLRASHSDFGQPPPYLINMQMHCIGGG